LSTVMRALYALAPGAARADPRPPRASKPLYPPRVWGAILGGYLALAVVVPVLHLAVPESSALHLSSYAVSLTGKITCYATVAVAMDLVWGYTGILSLGHGLFFALGGYAMGMYLMRAIGTEGVYGSTLPDFMVFLDWKELPWYWRGSEHFLQQAALAVLAPAAFAFVFGWFAFRSRIRGVYFSIITQALTYAFMLLFFRNQTGFGGNNGFTDFKRILGFSLASPHTRVALLVASATMLLATLAGAKLLIRSKVGRVLTAIRDAEDRLRFCGYDPVRFKLFIWTLSAAICGVAGALYVPQVGIINPSEMSPANSVEIAVWVAVGGRGTLLGPLLGAALINSAKSWLTVAFPDLWLYALGLVFIVVTRWLPDGVLRLVLRKESP
jgi:urea transport system permease protein